MRAINVRIAAITISTLVFISSSNATINHDLNTNGVTTTTTTRSFHETTELAELLWNEQNNHFVQQYEAGDFAEAFKTALRANRLAENAFGINDVNTADSLIKLGIINQIMGKLEAAEDHLIGALVILEEQLSPTNPDIAIALTNLGNLYYEKEDYSKVEEFHRKALAIRMNAFGKNDSSVAQSIYNLGVLYEDIGDYSKAESQYREAISIWTKVFGPLHPYVGNALNNLTNSYVAQSKFSDAIRIQQRTVAFKKSTLGIENREVAQSLIDLGTLYVEQGQYDIAGGTYREALSIAEDLLNPTDPQLAMLMYTLANAYHMQARMSQPGDSFAENDQLSDIVDANINMQTALLVNQALPLYERAVEILDKKQMEENQSTLQAVLSELVMLYRAIGEKDKAIATESRITMAQ